MFPPCKQICSRICHGSLLLFTSTCVMVGRCCTPAYLKKEGSACHPEVHRHCLYYGKRPNGLFSLLGEMWNMGSLGGKGGGL